MYTFLHLLIDCCCLFQSFFNFRYTPSCFIDNLVLWAVGIWYRQIIEMVFKAKWKVYNRIWHNRASVLPLKADSVLCCHYVMRAKAFCPTGAFYWREKQSKEQRRRSFGAYIKCEERARRFLLFYFFMVDRVNGLETEWEIHLLPFPFQPFSSIFFVLLFQIYLLHFKSSSMK